jgi:indole-3-glycerol phosphate synthase
VSGFPDALHAASTPVIMEVKRRSADGEDLLRGRSVAEIVDAYHALGAPCISVVTGEWFGGDDGLLREVAALTDRPILKKDFVTNERQIAGAKEMGAAAVLLTAELLPGALTARLADACLHHDVTPFVEITEPGQLQRLGGAEGCIVAASNKDIRRRERGEPRIERSLALLPAIRRSRAECAVSASGIADPAVAARLIAAGFDALLVGTALLRADDPRAWLEPLVRAHHPRNGREPSPQAADDQRGEHMFERLGATPDGTNERTVRT